MPLLPLLALLVLAPAAVAQETASVDPAITAAELEAKVRWLADDAREGRRTGTAGERVSAAWIAARMEAAGLEPGGVDGSWFQEFPVQMPPAAGDCVVAFGDARWTDVGTVAASRSAASRAPLKSAAYGMVLESHSINEFESSGVEGAVALVRRYTEFGPDPDPAFAALGNLRQKVKNAAAAGATAVILGTHPDDVARGGEAVIPFGAVPGTMPIPVVTVTPEQFATLEAAASAGEVMVTVEAQVVREERMARNVLGYHPGRTDEVLVVGGHYDHLGYGGQGSLAPGVHAIHNGADDNASGTAMVLELAEHRVAAGPAERGVLFALWSGEEQGLLGSAYWVDHPTVPLDRVLMNLNLDMVGRLGEGRVTVGSAATRAAFGPALDATAAWAAEAELAMSMEVMTGALPGGGGSDHMSFHKVDRAAVFFFSGLHADYHKPSDDADKVTFAQMQVLGLMLDDFLDRLDRAAAADFTYEKPAPPEGGEEREVAAARVWFGSIPDYGASPEGGGMQIAGTSPGSPAEKAGLLKGDVILQVGDVQVGDIYDFMDSLAKYENGQTVDVVLLRAGERKTLPLTFFPRAATGD
ncbi:MAG: M28 family peptidase [Planctomycetota bacterium]|jgi:hypothetical protein